MESSTDHRRDRSFENTVQNKALPPCDLNGFMDYLYYVERRAETLQFFLWYCDYVERWTRLPPQQRQLSPAWGPELAAEDAAAMLTESTATTTTTTIGAVPPLPKMPKMPKMPRAVAAMPDRALRHHHHRQQVNSSRPSSLGTRAVMATTSLTTTSRRVNVAIHTRSDSNKLKRILSILEDVDEQTRPGLPGLPAVPAQYQPFRDEVSRIVRHYLSADGPRALSDTDLFGPERAACLRAARRTTHPSALLPAFLAVEGVLRTQSFPAFAHRWCAANVHGTRLALGRAVAAAVLLAGITLDVLLVVLVAPVTASDATPRQVRLACLACLALWWPALTSLLASRTGVDVLLYMRRRRMLRPWEMEDEEVDVRTDKEAAAVAAGEYDDSDGSEKAPSSTFSRLDPLRKPSLQALGPRNDPNGEAWAVRNTHKPLWRRLYCGLRAASASTAHTVAVQDPGIRALQERAVLVSVFWAGLISIVAVVASLFIPGIHA